MNEVDKQTVELAEGYRKDLVDLCSFYYEASLQLEHYKIMVAEMEQLIGSALANMSLNQFETEKLVFTRFETELLIEEKGTKCDLH